MTENEAWMIIRKRTWYAGNQEFDEKLDKAKRVFEKLFNPELYRPTRKQELALRLLRAIREDDEALFACVVDDLMELAKKPEGFMSREEIEKHYESRIANLEQEISLIHQESDNDYGPDESDWGSEYDDEREDSLDDGIPF